ncbi:MAG: glycosyltransferase family 4 protein [Gammaproteobacteria bacterium]|nr:glycosyltransferase family 4 protein [Gammaproteobacteria bacterium]
MKIWYMNHYAGASDRPREGRSYNLARGIINAGSECAVIASSFHHFQRNNLPEQKETVLTKVIDDIPFLWLKTPKYKGNGLSRVLNMLSYAYACWRYDFVKQGLLEKPDVIIVTTVHPFHIVAGIKWAKRYGAKLVFEVRDLWPLSINLLLGVSKWHPLSIVLSVLERMAYKHSDLVTSVLPNALMYMGDKGVTSERFLYMPNGYLEDIDWADSNFHEQILTRIRSAYSRVIMHTGSMGPPNGLDILISAANQFKDNSDVAFVFIGDGILKKELIEMTCSSHIYHLSPIPKDQMQSALSYSDICYCGFQDLPELYKYGISPNKIFDYMMAKKFILLGSDSPNNPVELSGAGFCFKPSQDVGLYSIIKNIINFDNQELYEKGLRGYEYFKKDHDFNKIAADLLTKLTYLEILK